MSDIFFLNKLSVFFPPKKTLDKTSILKKYTKKVFTNLHCALVQMHDPPSESADLDCDTSRHSECPHIFFFF